MEKEFVVRLIACERTCSVRYIDTILTKDIGYTCGWRIIDNMLIEGVDFVLP